jgi:hypothetical protein
MHFRHHFHPAGHGTFFSGHIGSDRDPHRFVWVYDCGSKESSHLRGLIEDFHGQLTTPKQPEDHIDLLCISHFDSDHVNGLDLFFDKFRVKTLILPYMSLHARMRWACEVSEDETADAAAVAGMILDPVTYLQLREYGDRIGRIVLIRGHDSDNKDMSDAGVPPPAPEDDIRDLPDHKEQLRSRAENKTAMDIADDGYGCLGNSLAGRVTIRDDTKALGVDGVYEFVFYNRAWPKDLSPKSGAALRKIGADAAEIIQKYRMANARVAQRGWREALKKLYEHHFGATAKAKNEISLCVYGRSLLEERMVPCELYRQTMQGVVASLKLTNTDKTGVLMTGDIALDAKGLIALQKHLGPTRWQRTGLMQIPHHGSEHNWQSGNSRICKHDYSVICASGVQHHPHKEVLKDVRAAILSNYGIGVSFDYHAR